MPGDTWQQRWLASGAEDAADWRTLPDEWHRRQECGRKLIQIDRFSVGLLMLVCADVIRPSMVSMFSRHQKHLTSEMARQRDPEGFAYIRQALDERGVCRRTSGIVMLKYSIVLASKGGRIQDITAGDCIEAVEAQDSAQVNRGSGKNLFYEILHARGQFPSDAPPTMRAFRSTTGQRTVEELVDRYGIQCRPVRDLFVEYLKERQPGLDHSSLMLQTRILVGSFWRDLEDYHPGISSLRLTPEVAQAWKERYRQVRYKTKQSDGTYAEVQRPRGQYITDLNTIRAFYLDVVHWAAEDPARWGPWVAPSPITTAELQAKKVKSRLKARMDERTRARLPVLPLLVKQAEGERKAAAARLEALLATEKGEVFTVSGATFRRLSTPYGVKPWAQALEGGPRRNFEQEEFWAFWAWATIEVLRHTGIRLEEIQELSHHSITQYRLPTTGELVPLLQIAPSKTDEERLFLVTPELADVLSAIVYRVRDSDGTIPSVPFYDAPERVWYPPAPLLFQHKFGGERRHIGRTQFSKLIARTLTAAGLTDGNGKPLHYRPHDFRRIFVTDAILNGLPPHIAQAIVGHKQISTTMGYKAIYPTEAIEAHRAFIARRRSLRPSEEYRTPTNDEWDAFLGHFERRKLSIGTCGRAYGTDCIHEHACIRCSMLRPDPSERPRLEEIRSNLKDRIAEAERERWLGDIEGLQVSLAGAEGKIAQVDAQLAHTSSVVQLGLPSFPEIASQTSGST
ncbi:tyrosine-type recombinase/integrase [Streptomyces prunicolor]|uniref:tyrosine-type recombinase/integrase n=1 Tax=Streptomyces prunicolor TaxID=67348 RepID=UPI0033D12722